MKLRNLALALLFAPAVALAQNNEKVTEMLIIPDSVGAGESDCKVSTDEKDARLLPPDNNRVFETVETMPEFPGGDAGLIRFISNNIRYPKEAQEMGVQGEVIVLFVVTKAGKIGEVKIARSVHPALDAEAIRVVRLLPDFTPGKVNGHPVNVWYSLPINFRFADDDPLQVRIKEANTFVTLGDEALAEKNTAHAFSYYKEAFDILPSRTYLLERCETLLSDDPLKQENFYKWAIGRLCREDYLNGGKTDRLLSQVVKLQEKIVARHPNDLDELRSMALYYYVTNNYDNVHSTILKIYPLIPSNDIDALADIVELDAEALYLSKDYKGVVSLVAPKVDVLLKQLEDKHQYLHLMALFDSYIHLNKIKDAKKILSRIKETNPDDFDILMKSHPENEPELQPIVLELIKSI